MPKGTVVTATFGTTTSNGWPDTDTGQAWTTFGAGGTITASDYNASGGFGTMSVPQANAFRAGRLGTFNEADVDIACTFKVGRSPITGASVEPGNLMLRGTSITSYYLFRVLIQTNGTVAVVIFDPSNNLIGSVTISGLTYTGTSQLIRVRAQAIGQVLRVKVWDTAGAEPVGWPLTVIDDAYTGAGWVGVRCGVTFGNTNTTPVVFSIDNFTSVKVVDFAHDKVPLQVLAAYGADLTADWTTWTWTDITADALQPSGQGVTITPMGRSDGFSQAQPAGCAFVLKNFSGDYTAYNPASQHYPNVRRNTPIWVLVGPATRFFGYTVGWTPTWDASGRASLVSVTAAGSLRRLQHGTSPVRSPLYRAITSAGPVAYWPLEDGVDSTQAASGLVGGSPMRVNTGIMDFIDAGPVGSAGAVQPDVSADNALRASLVGTSSTAWQASIWFRAEPVDDTTQAYFVPLEVRTDNGKIYRMFAQWETDGTTVTAGIARYESEADTVESAVVTLDPSVVVLDGSWHLYQVTLEQSGSNTDVVFRLDGETSNSLTWSGFTLGRPISTDSIGQFGGLGVSLNAKNIAVAHIALFNSTTLIDQYDAGQGNVGETATDRLTRLCTEQGEQITITGDCDTAMGPQGRNTFVNLLRECEAADQGVLLDGIDAGLTYVTRQAKYDLTAALTVDATEAQLGQPFGPVDDDQLTSNQWTLTRTNGSSVTVADTDGPTGTDAIGIYDSARTVNVEADSALTDQASWLVHLGTVDGFRYPTIALNFRRSPGLIADWLAAPLQSRIDVTGVQDILPQHPAGTISLLLEGYTEAISPVEWTARANCSPYQPWRVIELAEDTGDTGEFICHLDTDGTTLAADAAQGATSLSLSVDSGPLWTTATDDFPQYLDVGGIKVKATAISGTSSPQTATVDSTTVTKDLADGTAVTAWDPPVLGL